MKYSAIVEKEFQEQKPKSKGEEINLLVPIDFSESSYISLSYAMRLASMCCGKIELFHSIKTDLLPFSESPLNIKRGLSSIELKARKKINSLIEIISENGVKVSSVLEFGSMSFLLHKEIEKSSSDIIVVGKDSAIEKLLRSLGREFNRPLLIVPPSIKTTMPNKVMMIRDNKPINEALLKPLSVIVNNGSKQLTVIDIKPTLLGKLMFKYPLPIQEGMIGVDRKFHNIKSSGDGLDKLITRYKPDMVCQIQQPNSFFGKLLEFIFSSRRQKCFNVPTLLIPAS